MKQMIRDFLHERYIKRLSRRFVAASNVQDRPKARMYWALMCAAILRRSETQVGRMERRILSKMDESARRIFEKHRVSPRVD